MTTYTIYSSSPTGYIRSIDTTDEADAANGLGDDTFVEFVGDGIVDSSASNVEGFYEADEGFLTFDTSGVSGTISDADLSLYVDTVSVETAGTLQVRLHDFGASLTTADWVNRAGLPGKTLLGEWDYTGSETGYQMFTDVAFAANINQSGNTLVLLHDESLLTTLSAGVNTLQFADQTAGGTTQDPKLVIEATPSGSPISGSSTITFSTSATLRGSGALVGSSSVTFTNAGILRGAGVLTGSSSVTFTNSGILRGTGALLGSSSLIFSLDAFLRGNAPISGSSSLTFSTSGAMIAVGLLSGSSSITFTNAGTLVGSGALLGSSNLTFSPSGTLVGSGRLLGSSSLTFTPAATGMLFRFASGSSSLTFSLSGSITGNIQISGSTTLTFTVSGNISYFQVPYEMSSGTYPDEIYSSGSGSGPFLYYETSGTNPDDIYEV